MALINRKKPESTDHLLGVLLDQLDCDVVVVRPDDCSLLFVNAAAKGRMEERGYPTDSCKNGYIRIFPPLCRQNCVSDDPQETAMDVEDDRGRLFSLTRKNITWTDGKPATALFLRDVDDERRAGERLYQLAYRDQLTGIPNRQRLKEDFASRQERIAQGKLCGIVAIFDLDNFKGINDTYGHNTGDIMLRRLTEHLESEPDFKGHLYRLGGDEFVMFYAEDADQYASAEDMRRYYDDMLQGAFLSYTMPNIELSCTISMGIAFFPQHGDQFSELLRRADIALYKAKGAGRNQKVFFEDKYDSAKKFTDLYINIQPLLMNSGNTFGYELIDRGNGEGPDDAEVNLAEFDRTMEVIGLAEVESGARYFIAYSDQLLGRAVLEHLPKDRFVIQVRPPIVPGERELRKYKRLKDNGYAVAVTGLRSAGAKPALMELADYVKFDKSVNDATRAKIIAANPGKIFIATGVDAPSDFEAAKQNGFKLFQGYFFRQQPVIKKTKEIDPLRVNYIRLLKLSCTDDYMDFKEISGIISSDVALSYKLLRILNSAAVGLRNVSSIQMAVAYLGEQNIKKWIALLALRGIASDQPLELVRTSLIRARFGELLAPHYPIKRNPKQVFLLGLLSLLHIALEKSREDMLEDIPVADDIRRSLLSGDGPYSDMIAFFTSYEYASWDEITVYAHEHKLSCQMINESYIAAVKWYNDLARAE